MQRILDIDLIINPILPWVDDIQKHSVVHQYKYSYHDYISKEKRHKIGIPIACGVIKRIPDPDHHTVRVWYGKASNGREIGPFTDKKAAAHLVAEITINGSTYSDMYWFAKRERWRAEQRAGNRLPAVST